MTAAEATVGRGGAPRRLYGERLDGTTADGRRFQAGVFNENEVRAAAGLTMAIGAVALVYAYFEQVYLPIRVVTVIFFVEFLIRVTTGLQHSPLGRIARGLTRREPPHWVSAKPKRFAWSIGLALAFAMAIGINAGVRGALPLTVCTLCLTLMWLEAVLGLCVGCEIHRLLVRRGWMAADADFEACTHGACAVEAPRAGGRR